MDQQPLLVVTEGALTGRTWPITASPLRIGRDPENEVAIDDARLSRQHARVLLHNGAVWVQDAGSRNGVFVNGRRVADHKQVKIGDLISFGGQEFEVRLTAGATASGAAERVESAPGREPVRAGGLLFVGLAVIAGVVGLVGWWILSTVG